VDAIADWTTHTSCTLIALDAPLGWPTELGRTLCEHQAGAPIHCQANMMFRRETDRFVRKRVGKQPLDVGADRIARTARAALVLLDELRHRTGDAIPLAWNPGIGAGIHAIEVYPGALLAAYGVEATGYKQKSRHIARQAVLGLLQKHIILPHDIALIEDNDDALDAVLCVLAAADFLRGDAVEPTDLGIAKKEGWIWVRNPIS